MPRRLVSALAAVAVAVAACSGDDARDVAEQIDLTTTTEAPTTTESTLVPKQERPRSCDALEEAAARVAVAMQIVTQLRSVDQYNVIKQGAVPFDAAQMLDDLTELRALQRVEVPAEVGTVRAALDTYVAATRLARDNFRVEDPFAEGGRGPDLVALTQDVGAFLRGQVALGMALDLLGCS